MRKGEEALRDHDDMVWAVQSANLMPLDPGNPNNKENQDCWFWIVRYEAFGSIAGPPEEFEVAILLDGTVVRPVLREQK